MKTKRNFFCWKCRSKKIRLTEICEVYSIIDIVDNKVVFDIGPDLAGRQTITGVLARCHDCKYEWKLRGIAHVGEVVELE